MRAMIQCMHENNYQNLTFPSKEKELQILCDSLGVANTTKTEIKIGSVHNNERLSTLLSDKTVNLDELNFLMKRLDSFDQKELTTFYAAAYAEKAETMTELINLSFNTHCYSLVADFSDLSCRVGEFDEDLIRRLILRIKVINESKIEIHFKYGIIMEQEIEFYED